MVDRGNLWCVTLAAAMLLGSAEQASAQTMFKCKDGSGRITYSNVPCEKQNLKDAGPVADRTTTLPLGAAQKPAAAAAPAERKADKPGKSAASDDAEVGVRPAAQIKPVVPLLEKFLK